MMMEMISGEAGVRAAGWAGGVYAVVFTAVGGVGAGAGRGVWA